MSVRLLVLGVIRILQPVHGYDVRRELATWRLDDYARPGSIYSALRTLEKDGCIARAEGEAGSGRRRAGGAHKTEYVLTAEGEKEFALQLREAWWTLKEPVEPLIPALCLLPFMNRRELMAALGARISQLEARLEQFRFVRAGIADGATGADGEIPEHVRETLDFQTARQRAELDWTRRFLTHLQEGRYHFADEADDPDDPISGLGIE